VVDAGLKTHRGAVDVAEEAIATSALSKFYGRTVGLEDLDLTVPQGTVFGYLGPNGAGKTTTIRLLVGLLRPSGGSASVLGLDVVWHRDEVQARIGYLPGEFVAYPDLTGREYLTYLGNLRGGVPFESVEAIAERLGT
jgi:ABC-2 type transport system ATP-binding protein